MHSMHVLFYDDMFTVRKSMEKRLVQMFIFHQIVQLDEHLYFYLVQNMRGNSKGNLERKEGRYLISGLGLLVD
ncbi:unnamed protein product [Absidia cylindrospora]